MDDTSIPVVIDDNEEANEEDLRIVRFVTTVHSYILVEDPDAGGTGEQGRGRR